MTPRATDTDEVVVWARSVPVRKTQGALHAAWYSHSERQRNPGGSLSETKSRSSLQNDWFWKYSVFTELRDGPGADRAPAPGREATSKKGQVSALLWRGLLWAKGR